VCAKDRVVVDLINRLPSTTTSIHWHGLYMHGEPLAGKMWTLYLKYKYIKEVADTT
jgi:hypothetical protein